jgi:two-component system response regulator PilR (NtrC family)
MNASMSEKYVDIPMTDVKVLLGDWKEERLYRIRKLLNHWILQTVKSPDEIIACAQKLRPNLVVVPLRWHLSEISYPPAECKGVKILEDLRSIDIPLDIVLFDSKVNALSLSDYCSPYLKGATSFIDENDPNFVNNLSEIIQGNIERNSDAKEDATFYFQNLGLVGKSTALHRIRKVIQRAAGLSDVPVLITGESGTGKELIARSIHHLDKKRRNGPFIAVNCGALTESIAESELFGHKCGSFTGAVSNRPGYFRAAHGGVLFLDEISELNLKLQPKLLRVLQSGCILPVGEEKEQEVDVRVIAATNRELMVLVEKGEFRLDLFYRINVLSIQAPELRDRKDDIESLVSFFLKKHSSCYQGKIKRVNPRVIEALRQVNFFGNVRELENLIRKILFNKLTGETIEIADLPHEILMRIGDCDSSEAIEQVEGFLLSKVKKGLALNEIMEQCEKILMNALYRETNGQRPEMARLLKITTRTIFNKLRRYAI